MNNFSCVCFYKKLLCTVAILAQTTIRSFLLITHDLSNDHPYLYFFAFHLSRCKLGVEDCA